VYCWADGIYVKAGLEQAKAALLVLIGALADGRKVILAVESGQRESTESWAAVLRALKARGLGAPKLTAADGHLGIWSALAQVWPESAEQRCWNHKLRNVVDVVPRVSYHLKFPTSPSFEIPYRHLRRTVCAKGMSAR
jgi:putative transposase